MHLTSLGSQEKSVQRPAVHDGSASPKPSAVQVSVKQLGRSHFGGFSVPGRPMQLQQSLTALQSAGSLHSASAAGPPELVEAVDDDVVEEVEEDADVVAASLEEEAASDELAPVEEEVAPPAPPSPVEDAPHPVETKSAVPRNNSERRVWCMTPLSRVACPSVKQFC